MPASTPACLAGWRAHTDRVNGIEARSWSSGSGRPIVLIHGIGPGTCGAANFEPVLQGLLAFGEVHVLDLIGFGASGRKPTLPYFDVELWREQIETLLIRVGGPATLIGNSIGGALAFQVAAQRSNLLGVVSIGSPLCNTPPTQALRDFWRLPANIEELGQAMAPMTAAGSIPPAERVAARFAVFAQPGYPAYFKEMLGQPSTALAAAAPSASQIAGIGCPITVIHGRADRACLAQETALAFIRQRPDADLVLFGDCGHNVAWERTEDLTSTLAGFLRRTAS